MCLVEKGKGGGREEAGRPLSSCKIMVYDEYVCSGKLWSDQMKTRQLKLRHLDGQWPTLFRA